MLETAFVLSVWHGMIALVPLSNQQVYGTPTSLGRSIVRERVTAVIGAEYCKC